MFIGASMWYRGIALSVCIILSLSVLRPATAPEFSRREFGANVISNTGNHIMWFWAGRIMCLFCDMNWEFFFELNNNVVSADVRIDAYTVCLLVADAVHTATLHNNSLYLVEICEFRLIGLYAGCSVRKFPIIFGNPRGYKYLQVKRDHCTKFSFPFVRVFRISHLITIKHSWIRKIRDNRTRATPATFGVT